MAEGLPSGSQVALTIEGHLRGVAAATSRQSLGQRGGSRVRQKIGKKSNG